MVRFRLLCGDFLLPDPALYLDNRMTVCMGYTAMTPQGRAGKRRRKGQESHVGRTAHPTSTGQNGQLMWWMTQSVISQKDLLRYGSPHVDILSTRGELPQPKSMWTNCPHWFYPCYGWPQLDILSSHGEIWWILLFSTYQIAVTWSLCARLREPQLTTQP